VEVDRHAVLCRAEIIVLFQNLAMMVRDSIILRDVRAEHLDQLVPLVRPMQAGGDQDEDAPALYLLLFERAQKGRQDHAIGYWPRNVAHKDTRITPAAGKLGQRRRAGGVEQGLL